MRPTKNSDHLKQGMRLPSLLLRATDGSDIDLAALAGRCAVAVYPWTGRACLPNPPHWDDIPGAHGSTPELEGFRDLDAEFRRLGVRLFAFSRQATDYQRELVSRLGLTFQILSDADGLFTTALRLPSFTTGGETYLQRLTLVLTDGVIEYVFHPVSDPASHAGDVLRWLKRET